MIQKERFIPELYDLNHRNDTNVHTPFDYETDLYNKLYSDRMFLNPQLNNFLTQMKKTTTWWIESVLIIKNLFNFTVDKHYNGHLN
jgi:hypothetical protein